MIKQEADDRRMFLKHLVAGTATAVGASVIIKPVKAGGIPEAQTKAAEILYRETEEFKNYYKSLRL